jgi:hypothetical protein
MKAGIHCSELFHVFEAEPSRARLGPPRPDESPVEARVTRVAVVSDGERKGGQA